MPSTIVPSRSSFDMIGPYLVAAKAVCPASQFENVLVHVESYSSPVKASSVCSHIVAFECDDDDNRTIEFEH